MKIVRCLIDTNVFIQLEEAGHDGRLRESFAAFGALAQKNNVILYYHPLSESDISRDRNVERREKTLSFLNKYPKLENPPVGKPNELELFFKGIAGPNDLIDCQILYALKSNCVDFLISEDSGIHRRAKYAKLNNRVFSVIEATVQLQKLFDPKTLSLPLIDDLFVYEIEEEDPILESLRGDYPGFDSWITKCRLEHRKAWVIKNKDRIDAICIRKIEEKCEYANFAKALKLCTFKVSEYSRGNKFGELFLKMAFSFCVENNIDTIYLTAFSKHEYLVEFLKDFGFLVYEKPTELGELVFYKNFSPPKDLPLMNPVDFHVRYSPHYYDQEEIKKFVVPIRPDFHDTLFPELVKQQSFDLFLGGQMIPGNTIKKVYLCKSNIREVDPGSLLYFYRSRDSEITSLAVVEESIRTSDFNTAIQVIGKRSVFSFKELKDILEKETLIITFRLVSHLDRVISLRELLENGILKGAPQQVHSITHDRYLKLKQIA